MSNQNQKMGSIVLKSLSILLGLFFIFVGFIKISSVLSKDLHKDLVSVSKMLFNNWIDTSMYFAKFGLMPA